MVVFNGDFVEAAAKDGVHVGDEGVSSDARVHAIVELAKNTTNPPIRQPTHHSHSFIQVDISSNDDIKYEFPPFETEKGKKNTFHSRFQVFHSRFQDS